MQAIFFDLDGVFYVGDQLIHGAIDTLQWCDENHIPYLFITNTTSKPPQAIFDKLLGFGIETQVSRIDVAPGCYGRLVGKQKGIQHISTVSGEQPKSMFSEFQIAKSEEESTQAVIVGDMGEGWSFDVMNRAFRQLMQEPSPCLIALGMTRYWRAQDGLRLDAGAFVTALQYASGIEPIVLGKPAPAFFDAAMQRLAVTSDEIILIGDDIKGDIDGAQQAGIRGLLVRTGKFRPADLDGPIKPYAVIDSIADLPSWWLKK